MMLVFKRRFLEHAATANVRYTQAIINHGREAGASIAHPHGQLLGLPFVPGEILDEQRAFSRFDGGCILCATLEAELGEGERVVFANDDVVCVCPYWSGSPYELLIIPRDHELHLTDASDESLAAVGQSPSATPSSMLRDLHGDVAYNIGLPHRAAPLQRRVPLARAPVAEAGHHGRLRARHRRDDQHRPARASPRSS